MNHTPAGEHESTTEGTRVHPEATMPVRARVVRTCSGLLGRHPTRPRQVIRALLAGERWDAEPFDDASGRGCRLHVVGDYRRLMGREFASITVGHFASTVRWC
jgi:hypothetical protein